MTSVGADGDFNRAPAVKIERNIVTAARECDRQRIDPAIRDDDRRETNRAPQNRETSVHPLGERSLISARHVASRRIAHEFDNPFTKESKHVPRGASSPTWTVGRVGLIDNVTMSISDGIILDDERRMSGPPIG